MAKNDEFENLSVTSEPAEETDVPRKSEMDSKADAQGGTIGDETPLESLHTEEETITGASRRPLPIASTDSKTLYCDPINGSDDNDGSESQPLATIQEAVDRVPIYNPDQWIIDLATVPDLPVRYDEDVKVGPYNHYSSDGLSFRIIGDRQNPQDIEIGSMMVNGCQGVRTPSIWGVTFTRPNSAISQDAALFIYATQEASVQYIRFEPEDGVEIDVGVEAYSGSAVDCRDVDVSNVNHGLHAKRESTIWATETFGTANNYVYWSSHASHIGWYNDATTPSAGEGMVRIADGSSAASRNTFRTRDFDARTISINDQETQQRTLVEAKTPDATNTATTLTFDGLSAYTKYVLEYQGSVPDGTGPVVEITFNGDDSSGAYRYYDEAWTLTENADTIPLFTSNTGNFSYSGELSFTRRHCIGFDNSIQSVRWPRADNVVREASTMENAALNSLEVHIRSWDAGENDGFVLWELTNPY